MSEHNTEDLEAFRLNLAQVAAAPDTWRARAVAAGGFLGAAAAVSLWGLSQEAARFSGAVVDVAGAAAVFYVLAVVGFLIASVLPSPSPDPSTSGTLADQLHELAHKETRPIKCLVLISAALGSIAILLTTIGSLLVVQSPAEAHAMVSFSDKDQRSAVKRLCPGIADPFPANVVDDGSEFLRVRVLDPQCDEESQELLVPRSGLLRLGPSTDD